MGFAGAGPEGRYLSPPSTATGASPRRIPAISKVSVTEKIQADPLLGSLLFRGLSRDNPYTTPAIVIDAAESSLEEDANIIPDPVTESTKHNLRLPRRGGLVLASALVALPLMGVTAGCAGFDEGNGPITKIMLTWGGVRQPAPSNYDDPVAEAGKICPGKISKKIVVGVAAVEDGPVFNWNPDQLSPAKPPAIGAMQFEQATWDWGVQIGIFEAGSPTDVPTAIHNGTEYLCYLYNHHGGDLDATLEAYNGGASGYASEVEAVASTVEFDYQQQNTDQQSNRNNGNGNKKYTAPAANGKLPDNTYSTTLVLPQEVDFWNDPYEIADFKKSGSQWVDNNLGVSLQNGQSRRDRAGQMITLRISGNSATMTVSG